MVRWDASVQLQMHLFYSTNIPATVTRCVSYFVRVVILLVFKCFAMGPQLVRPQPALSMAWSTYCAVICLISMSRLLLSYGRFYVSITMMLLWLINSCNMRQHTVNVTMMAIGVVGMLPGKKHTQASTLKQCTKVF
jgi:hypothetical protein